jgi:RimJ/RimL family protein N-acetyltransferase
MFSPLFTGRLVRLAAATPDDQEALAAWSLDDMYLRMLDDDPIRPQTAASYHHASNPDGQGSVYFHLRTLQEDKFVGFVVLHSIKWASQTSELAIAIGLPEYRGKGYGQDALRLILNYAFAELNLYRVGLTVMAYNTAAIKSYERAGFILEGAKRQMVCREGQRHDLLIYGILRDEWAEKRETPSS